MARYVEDPPFREVYAGLFEVAPLPGAPDFQDRVAQTAGMVTLLCCTTSRPRSRHPGPSTACAFDTTSPITCARSSYLSRVGTSPLPGHPFQMSMPGPAPSFGFSATSCDARRCASTPRSSSRSSGGRGCRFSPAKMRGFSPPSKTGHSRYQGGQWRDGLK